MNALLAKLEALLVHKIQVLTELAERQKALREFLIKPDWYRFFEMTQPQEALLTNLQQIMAAQDALLTEIAKRRGLQRFKSLKALLPYVDARSRDRISDAIDQIRHITHECRKYSRQSQMLQQAQWKFLERWANQGVPGALQQPNAYNAQGYAHQVFNTHSRIQQQV
ncbi:flagellar export chaperone FlgN [Acanthopleuribacter pedis]|uniref:Flagellar export chaperone FlgN n=1 Tax=Acanthopleuribacter pedis TaxID=442870 RepID=A0A8J7QAC0_9BACT|nr:flagellar export chaperone FlgN [Acanthopleuribacter pedis]